MDYKDFVRGITKHPSDINRELTDRDCDLLHMSLGITGEVGELVDAIKKHVIYRKDIDFENVKEELGDIMFYMVGLCHIFGLELYQVIEANREKLEKRYSLGAYSDQQAQQRADKEV
jgi:NTP pyrophosphatase (non-canonical NTP hydrolase)